MASRAPYYARTLPRPQREDDFSSAGMFIDLTTVRLPSFPDPATAVAEAQRGFDGRAAACVRARVAPLGGDVDGVPWGPVQVYPEVETDEVEVLGQRVLVQRETSSQPRDLLELKHYGEDAPDVHLVTSKCLAALAYREYFPETLFRGLDELVRQAVLAAGPGWCGTFGPGTDDTVDLVTGATEGNYDMNQMHLLPMAYRFYDVLGDAAREHLITVLLARGRIHRVSLDDTFTSGGAPEDWSRAGYALPHKRIGETENHQIMMMTTRYLTNQLLYQREPLLPYDNRRNDPDLLADYEGLAQDGDPRDEVTARLAAGLPTATPRGGSCTAILLSLLQSYLRADFSEYNAKNYQLETRQALLNLCSYAYDHEVRLAARMVLDHVAAHVAVSSSDLRRLVPFRRLNKDGKKAHDDRGFLQVPLIGHYDGDPMAAVFALAAGNVRAYEGVTRDTEGREHVHVHVHGDGGDQLCEALGDHRVPPSVLDLFVVDASRRFFQRLHRSPIEEDWIASPHNADVTELFAGSPSYLLSAGGQSAGHAIDPRFFGVVVGDQDQQLGAAVTTSFMPTLRRREQEPDPLLDPRASRADELIQFSRFGTGVARWAPHARNHGVGPDFLCGEQVRVPDWFKRMGGARRPDGTPAYDQVAGFTFLDKGSSGDGSGRADGPGFYLALYQQDGLGCMEAFDTWLWPDVSFNQFKDVVFSNNQPVSNGGTFALVDGRDAWWTTYLGHRLRFRVWTSAPYPAGRGAEVLEVREYSAVDPLSALGDAGNRPGPFLSGTVMRSPADAVTTISNPRLGTTLTLDLGDHLRPRRTGEDGAVEQAGDGGEVWLDLGRSGPERGDVCQPYATLAAAEAAVAPGGTIRVVPSSAPGRGRYGADKAVRLVAPIGGVRIG